MDNLKEITAIWDKINELEKKLSGFTDMRHSETVNRVSDVEEALCEISELMEEE